MPQGKHSRQPGWHPHPLPSKPSFKKIIWEESSDSWGSPGCRWSKYTEKNQSQLNSGGWLLQPLAINESHPQSVRTNSPTRDIMAVSLLPGTSPPASLFHQPGSGARAALTFFRLCVGDLQVAVGSFQLLSPHNLLL